MLTPFLRRLTGSSRRGRRDTSPPKYGSVSRGLVRTLSGVLAALLLGLAPASRSEAQDARASGTIEGRVLNIETGSYLNNARIRVPGTAREAFTNDFGEYRLTDVPAGSVTLEVFFTGLAEQTATVDVPAGGVTEQNFRLARPGVTRDAADAVVLDAFVVSSSREYDARAIAINEQRFSGNLRNVVSTDAYGEVSQGNLGEFMKHIPGVTIEYNGQNASGIQVRGFTSNFTQVTLDGGTIASAASPASTQNHTRQFGLEQANINNLSRIEVVKLPTPDMSANLLGGAVNLVSKSAFERERAELRYATYFSFNSEYLDFGKTPGPGRSGSRKILPSADFTWTVPINDQLGVVVTGATVNTFSQTQQTVPGRRWTEGGATVDNPYTNSFRGDLSMARTERNSASFKVDWKPLDRHLLSLTLQTNAYTGFTRTNRVSYNPGTFADWGETFTTGAVANNTNANQSITVDDKHGLTHAATLNYDFTGEDWVIEAGATLSESYNRNRDTDKGFFRNYNARAYPVRQINFVDIDNGSGAPGAIELFDGAGNRLETSDLNNYILQNVTSQPSDAEDTNVNGRVALTRHFDQLPFPLAIKVGSAYEKLERDISYEYYQYNYIGPGGAVNNLANTAEPYFDESFGAVSPGFSYPTVEFASPWEIYEAFQEHPEYFAQTTGQANDTLKNAAVRSPLLQEAITAHYVMGDAKLWQNRIRLVAGVRYELTETEGYGYKQTLTGYERRANFNSREYDGYYPSGHLTFSITDDLLLRFAYAKTIGRPRLVDIVPGVFIGENSAYDGSAGSYPGWITSSNTTLVPWEANNYDLALQYYLPQNGLLSAGVFRKDVTNFFGTYRTVVDAEIADQLGLSDDYLGWQFTTRINTGDARIDGLELSYEQALGFFGDWGRPFSVFANYTKLQLEGSNESDFNDFIPETANIGLRATFGRFSGLVKWNYRGKQLREYDDDWFPGAGEYIRAYPTVDVNLEYNVNPRVVIFATARNLLNEPYQWERSGPGVPGWSTLTSSANYGAQYTLGVKGTF